MSAWERIEATTGVAFDPDFTGAYLQGARSEAAGMALEELLARSGSPELYARGIAEAGADGWTFLRLLGCSRLFASILLQNPELTVLLLDRDRSNDGEPAVKSYDAGEPREMYRGEQGATLFGARVAHEAALGLAAASGYRHALDRLRYVQQWATAMLVWYGSSGDALGVAAGLSATADALLKAARDAAWAEFAKNRGLGGECPLTTIGFGKLGGRELNLSSDIDLVYVLPNGIDEKTEREMTRFCEAFGRAVEEPMGRGFLYRVDLRLRPYGARGALASSMRAHEAYYRNYAEDWEVQALLRSRPLFGPMAESWEAMRSEILAGRTWGSTAVEGLVAMRGRTEESAEPNDVKRGAGGIRDVEWVAQIGALLTGKEAPSLPRDTLGALNALGERGALEPGEVDRLTSGYRVLRNVEHALQARGDQQTHLWPEGADERELIAGIVRPTPATYLQRSLDNVRRDVRGVYAARLLGAETPRSTRPDTTALSIFLSRFESAYQASVAENEGSSERIATALDRAPLIMDSLRDAEIVEELISGEIAEFRNALGDDSEASDFYIDSNVGLSRVEVERLSRVQAVETSPNVIARLRREHARRWLRFALYGADPSVAPSSLPRRHPVGVAFSGSGLEVFVLGSVASRAEGPESDTDLLLLRDDDDDPQRAERAAREALKALDAMRREGAPASIDLRLRPQGSKGDLVQSVASFRRYEQEEMEPWERLALIDAELILTRPYGEAREAVRAAAYRRLEAAGWRDLLAIKDRVESERGGGADDLKLGPGGAMDAEWTIRTRMMAIGGDAARMTEAGTIDEGTLEAGTIEDELRPHVAAIVSARRTSLLRGRGDMLSPSMQEALGEATVARVREAQKAIRSAWLRAREEIEALC